MQTMNIEDRIRSAIGRIDRAVRLRRMGCMQRTLRLSAWLAVAALTFVTLSPIGLRPSLAPPNLERALAYAALGLLLVLAYPRHGLVVLVGVVVLAGGLEFGQALTATRHGRVGDFLIKAGAATLGSLLALTMTAVVARRRPREPV